MLTLALALGGISTFAVAATELLGTIITGELPNFLRTWRMRKRIDALDRHVIVCGYGHVGRHVCADLLGYGVPVVVIDLQERLARGRGDAARTPCRATRPSTRPCNGRGSNAPAR